MIKGIHICPWSLDRYFHR